MAKAFVLAGMAIGMVLVGSRASAQAPTDRESDAQKAAIARLAPLDGIWRGTATINLPNQPAKSLTHTERVGPMLGGVIEVIEGKSYNADGSEAGFNALAVVSCASTSGGCEIRSYAQGRAGTFPFSIRNDGFDWSTPAGPDAVVSYHAVIANGTWHEEGWYEKAGKKLAKVYEADLKRVGPTDWPAGGAIKAR